MKSNVNTNLYNKYRPISFNDLVGQKIVKQVLINSIKNKEISHAHIFSGPRGTGKTSCARIFAKAVNCLEFKDDICNNCINCTKINLLQTPDLIELDGASNNGVDHIRQLVENAYYLPADLKIKVFIIDEAHMLTTNAWNALLKIVEEPPKHVLFLFSTTEFNKIIPTIQSRCMKHYFFLMEQKLLVSEVERICHLEKCEIELTAAKKIATLANGSLRDCLSLLSQIIIFSNRKITLSKVQEALFLVDQSIKLELLEYLFAADVEKALQLIENLYYEGYQLHNLINEINALLIDLWVYQSTKNVKYLINLNLTEVEKLNYQQIPLSNWINILEQAEINLKKDKNNLLFIKIALMKLFNSFNQSNPTESLSTSKLTIKQNSQIDYDHLKVNQKNKQQQQSSLLVDLVKEENQSLELKEEKSFNNQYVHNFDLFKTRTKFVNQKEIFNQLKNTNNDLLIKDLAIEPESMVASDQAINQNKFNSHQNLILWTFKKADKNKTELLKEKIEQIEGSLNLDEENDVWLKEVLDHLVKNKTKVLASRTTAMFNFENLTFSRYFNELLLDHKYINLLNNYFQTNFYWTSIHKDQFTNWAKMKNSQEPLEVVEFRSKNGEKIYDKILKDLHIKPHIEAIIKKNKDES